MLHRFLLTYVHHSQEQMNRVMHYVGLHATARSVEDETRNAEFNGNRNPECWGDFSQLVKIEKLEYLGISRYKVELRF